MRRGHFVYVVNFIYDPVSAATVLVVTSAAAQTPWDSWTVFNVQEMRLMYLVTFRVSNRGFILTPTVAIHG